MYHLLQHPPHLGVGVMAAPARAEAVSRLRASAPAFPAFTATLIALADQIEATPPADPQTVSRFIQFSLALDRSRDQKLRDSLPDLARLSRKPPPPPAGTAATRAPGP